MDDLLRTYARKRRDDAGEPALHPATRRLLLAEAAKRQADSDPRPVPRRRTHWMSWLAGWPRIAVAACLFLFLGFVVWNVLPLGRSRSQLLLAQKESGGDSSDSKSPAPDREAAGGGGEKNRERLDRDAAVDGLNLNKAKPYLSPSSPGRTEDSRRGFGAAASNSGNAEFSTLDDKPVTLRESGKKEAALGESRTVNRRVVRNLDGSVATYFERGTATNSAPTGFQASFSDESLMKDRPLAGVAAANSVTNALGLSYTAAGDRLGGTGVRGGAGDLGAIPAAIPPTTAGATTAGDTVPGAITSRAGAAPKGSLPPTAEGLNLSQNAPNPTALRGKAMNLQGESEVLLARQDSLARPAPETRVPAVAAPQTPSPLLRARVAPAPAASPVSGPATPTASLAASPTESTWRFRFMRETATNPSQTTKQPVVSSALFSSFDFEQNGDQVRVIDSDGSVYTGHFGTLQDLDAFQSGDRLSADKAAATPVQDGAKLSKNELRPNAERFSKVSSRGTNLIFRVFGTNLSSGQPVTFEGHFAEVIATSGAREILSPKSQQAPGSTVPPAFPRSYRASTVTAAGATPMPATDLRRIVGHARIGASNDVPIVAVPAAR
jgi:hypothetical protein